MSWITEPQAWAALATLTALDRIRVSLHMHTPTLLRSLGLLIGLNLVAVTSLAQDPEPAPEAPLPTAPTPLSSGPMPLAWPSAPVCETRLTDRRRPRALTTCRT